MRADGVAHQHRRESATVQGFYNANCKGNPKVKCFWSPNRNDDGKQLGQYWPGKEYVDIVGIDIYPDVSNGVPTFSDTYGDFYNTYASPNNLPFAIGETGIGGDTAPLATREEWLKNIINPSSGLGDFPLYMSATWFEYGPPANSVTFYIVEGLSKDQVDETISNTREGSA